MNRTLAADANENLETALTKLGEHASGGTTREFGPVVASTAGFPAPIYNRVFVFERPPRDDFQAAVAWMDDQDVPYWVTATERVLDTMSDTMTDLGLETAHTQPGMAITAPDEIPSNDTDADISAVQTQDELDAFVSVATSVFGTPVDIADRLYQHAFEFPEDSLYLGRVDGDPAACGLLMRNGDVAGVYTIGVLEPYRRRGIGEAMSWAVVRAGRDAGCDVAVLQSTEMAYPLYRRMGFETVVTYHQFEPSDGPE